MTGIILCVP
jgi:hypothetical protein